MCGKTIFSLHNSASAARQQSTKARLTALRLTCATGVSSFAKQICISPMCFEVPLTRSYDSSDWVHSNPVHAFGKNSNHPYDIVPVGTRNPYTYQMILLEDGDFLYFDRISKGTGYADAVYQHTETYTRFYNATQTWNGNGWTMKLADGWEIRFPEAYSAKNAAK